MEFPVDELKKWFVAHKRPLPWREDPTPYQVWVSEVMLQQTQSSVVIPYYERWLTRFPTVKALAESRIEDVIKEWEGLGYYSRARNLHEGAKQIIKEFGGQIPSDKDSLSQIKGIGPYTCGAILSFAFHKRAPCCDGNVYRLLSRFFAIEDPVDRGATQKEIWTKVEDFLPESDPWVISEALIECGATICQKEPKCIKCPLKRSCKAYSLDKTKELPRKSKVKETTILHRTVAVIMFENEFLLKKGVKGKVMGELYEFPYQETNDFVLAAKNFEKELGPLEYVKPLAVSQHSFTRFKAFLYPHLFKAKERIQTTYHWIKEPHLLPFSSGHRRILQGLKWE
jgi:A/G-specific adenine glycosylase